ncbi:hypothetical protein MEBOL_002999 [Melittangium boletus DSM 14713]|uniref:TIGR02265 family protein n=2 Tax=Melittangium boletus TaxID=83453 RepID=A0A250ICG2_9BACT|nr:hypothetical protein MEBOL_002999 [Melittangium boletus DSM 14713]
MTSDCGLAPDLEPGDSLEDLSRRLALVIPGDTVRGTFFLGTLDMVRECRGEAGVRRCLAAVDEPRFMEFFHYPVGTFLRLNEAAVVELTLRGEGNWTWAQRRLGRRAAADLLSSAAGRALVLLSRGETRRLMGNLPSAYRAAVNHGERSVVWEGERRGRVIMRRDFMPCAFHEGLLAALLESTKAQGVGVQGARLDVLDGEYRVEWE